MAEAHYHSGQQIMVDLGNLMNLPGHLYTGFEYQIWNKKFGIKDGTTEHNLKYMVQWKF